VGQDGKAATFAIDVPGLADVSPIVSENFLGPTSTIQEQVARGVMIYKIGRALQVVGMIVLPVGMVGNVYDPHLVTVQESLVIAGVGVVIFGLGWVLQQAGRPR
jgi:hypothetical protein